MYFLRVFYIGLLGLFEDVYYGIVGGDRMLVVICKFISGDQIDNIWRVYVMEDLVIVRMNSLDEYFVTGMNLDIVMGEKSKEDR